MEDYERPLLCKPWRFSAQVWCPKQSTGNVESAIAGQGWASRHQEERRLASVVSDQDIPTRHLIFALDNVSARCPLLTQGTLT